MNRDELLALDKEVLFDLILRLHERVAALEAGAGLQPKGPGNSSIPPSAGYKANRAERRKKKRGPKTGHQGLSRRRATPRGRALSAGGVSGMWGGPRGDLAASGAAQPGRGVAGAAAGGDRGVGVRRPV